MRIDYGGAVIPWYESPLIGGFNYTWQERPPEAPVQDKSTWGQGGGGGGLFGGFFENLDDAVNTIPGGWATVAAIAAPQLAPLLTGSALTAAQAAALSAGVSGTSSIVQGDPLDVALQKAALSGAGSYGGQYLAGNLGENIGLPSETPYIDIPDGEFLLTPDVSSVPSLLPEVGLTPAEIDLLTTSAPETGTEISAYTTPIEMPVIGQPYDATPLTDPVTGQPFGSIEDPLVDNYMDGFTSVSETGLPTLPDEGMQVDLPGTTILGDLGLAGAVETPIPSSGISAMDVLRGVNAAKGLLGSGQEQAVAPATQFKGTRVPSGQVDYSGILSLLQMQSPQRRSLLG